LLKTIELILSVTEANVCPGSITGACSIISSSGSGITIYKHDAELRKLLFLRVSVSPCLIIPLFQDSDCVGLPNKLCADACSIPQAAHNCVVRPSVSQPYFPCRSYRQIQLLPQGKPADTPFEFRHLSPGALRAPNQFSRD